MQPGTSSNHNTNHLSPSSDGDPAPSAEGAFMNFMNMLKSNKWHTFVPKLARKSASETTTEQPESSVNHNMNTPTPSSPEGDPAPFSEGVFMNILNANKLNMKRYFFDFIETDRLKRIGLNPDHSLTLEARALLVRREW